MATTKNMSRGAVPYAMRSGDTSCAQLALVEAAGGEAMTSMVAQMTRTQIA